MSGTTLPCSSALVLAALASPALAQLTVGPSGSGATFVEIADALAVASIGETLLVEPGSYAPFVVSQGVSIVGAGSGQTQLVIPSGSLEGAIDITQVPTGQSVRISGLSIAQSSTSTDGRIEITQCAGRIELVDVESLHPTWGITLFVDEPTLRIEDCAAVLLDDCTLFGSHPPHSADWMAATSALLISNSSVWINASKLQGGSGGEGYGAEALAATNGSFVHVSRSELYGGYGGNHFGFYWWDIYGFSGEEAIYAADSEIVLTGGPGNVAHGAEGTQLSSFDWTGGGAAVQLGDNATLRYSSDVVLERGADGDGTNVGPEVFQSGAGTLVVAEPVRRPTLHLEPAGVHPGQVVDLRTSGNPGATQLTFAAFDGIAPLALGSSRHLHIAPAAVFALPPIALDGTGIGALPIPVPPVASLSGFELILQSLDANLVTLRVSNPALVTVLN